MKTKTFSPMGALHPILFFAGVYVVVLFFSIFICSALFYSLNPRTSQTDVEKTLLIDNKDAITVGATVAMR